MRHTTPGGAADVMTMGEHRAILAGVARRGDWLSLAQFSVRKPFIADFPTWAQVNGAKPAQGF